MAAVSGCAVVAVLKTAGDRSGSGVSASAAAVVLPETGTITTAPSAIARASPPKVARSDRKTITSAPRDSIVRPMAASRARFASAVLREPVGASSYPVTTRRLRWVGTADGTATFQMRMADRKL